MLTSVYFMCIENVNLLWDQLTKTSPKQVAEENEAEPEAEV